MPIDSFNNAVRPVLFVFQLMGTLPVNGILQRKPIDLRFKWISLRSMFSLLIIIIGLVMCCIEYKRLERIGVNAKNSYKFFFYVDTVLIMFLMINTARKWRSVALRWHKFDNFFPATESAKMKRTLRSRIRITSWILILCGITEQVLFRSVVIFDQYREAKYCQWDVDDFPRYFAQRHYTFIFKVIPYNISIVLFFEYAKTALKMVWICQDLIIIIVSIGLTYYFKQIYAKVKPFGSGIMIADENFWIEIRSQYVLLCNLVIATKDLLNPLVLTSCGTNLYLICFQLVNITKNDESMASVIKNWYALIYLIVKMTLVFYSAAMINETAKAPLAICTKIPTSGWCLELDRFTNQLRTQRVALSGWGLFDLTKRTMLAMTGIVISYQLVMLKLAETTEGIGQVEPCSKLAFSIDYHSV